MCVLAYIILFLKVIVGGQESSPEIILKTWISTVSLSFLLCRKRSFLLLPFSQEVVVRRFQKIRFPSA